MEGSWEIYKRYSRLCVLQENGDVRFRVVIISLLCSSLTTVGGHLGNALMSLADSKTRFSISVGTVEALALVSDIDLIWLGLDDKRLGLMDQMWPALLNDGEELMEL